MNVTLPLPLRCLPIASHCPFSCLPFALPSLFHCLPIAFPLSSHHPSFISPIAFPSPLLHPAIAFPPPPFPFACTLVGSIPGAIGSAPLQRRRNRSPCKAQVLPVGLRPRSHLLPDSQWNAGRRLQHQVQPLVGPWLPVFQNHLPRDQEV